MTTPTGNVAPHVAAAIRAAGLNCLAVCNSPTEGRGEPWEVWLRRQPIEKFCDPAELERWVKRRQALEDRPVGNKRSVVHRSLDTDTLPLFDDME